MVASPVLLIAAPLLLAFIAPLCGKAAKYIPPAGALFNLILSIILIPTVLKSPMIVSIGGFPPPFCINLFVGPLGIFFAALISLAGFLISIYALSYIRERAVGKYHTLYLLLLTGATGVVLTGDIFNLFVFYEILCISSYALTAHNAHWHRHGTEAAVKYLIQGSVGSAFILLAIGMLYGLFGTLNMADLAKHITRAHSSALFIPLTFFIAGFGVEAAIFPLNAWLPDAHSVSPAPISAIFSGIAIEIGVYAIMRVVFTLFGAPLSVMNFLLITGLLTLLVGEICAFRQNNIKRMSAYSSIGQIGLIVFAFGLATKSAVTAGLFQITSHALSKILLFLTIGYMIYSIRMKNYPDKYVTEIEINSLNGLGKKMPLTSLGFTIAAFSLIGFPPFIGFSSKLLIVKAALLKGGIYPVLMGIALIATVIEGAYLLKVVQGIYFKEGKVEGIREKGVFFLVPLFILAALIIFAGVYPGILTKILNFSSGELLNRIGYIRSVLG